MNRNIKISAGPSADDWGCRVLIYGYLEVPVGLPPFWKNGYGKIFGVEFDHCGQYDTTYAGLRIENTGEDTNASIPLTEVQGSSFHNCGGFCIFIDDISNATINNNVLFWARKFIVYVEDTISNYTFSNNFMVGAREG